jgi:hypothetical protein
MRRALLTARLPVFITLVLAVHVFVLVLAAIGLGHLLAALRNALPPRGPSPFDNALRTRARPTQRLPELERMEREVALGLATAFDLHYRLRPRLRRIATELLAARRGIDLDGNPDAARRALGEDAWQIVRGDLEPPPERFAPGVDIASLRLAVASLEGL